MAGQITVENGTEYFLLSIWMFMMIYGFFGGILLMASTVSYNLANGIGLFLAMSLTTIFVSIAMCMRLFTWTRQTSN